MSCGEKDPFCLRLWQRTYLSHAAVNLVHESVSAVHNCLQLHNLTKTLTREAAVQLPWSPGITCIASESPAALYLINPIEAHCATSTSLLFVTTIGAFPSSGKIFYVHNDAIGRCNKFLAFGRKEADTATDTN